MKSQTLSSQWAGPPKILSCVVALRCTAGDIRICSMAQRGLSVCVCELKTNQFLWDLKIVCAPPPYLWPSDIRLLHIDVEDLLWWWSWFCFITPDGKCGFTTPWDHSENKTHSMYLAQLALLHNECVYNMFFPCFLLFWHQILNDIHTTCTST